MVLDVLHSDLGNEPERHLGGGRAEVVVVPEVEAAGPRLVGECPVRKCGLVRPSQVDPVPRDMDRDELLGHRTTHVQKPESVQG